MKFKFGIGQDSHRFTEEGDDKPLMLGGLEIPGERRLAGNSDADVALHALCNAISGISGVNILGAPADKLCREGITDSAVYVREARKTLGGWEISHVSVSLECLRPKLAPHIDAMRMRIAEILGITPGDVGVTATSGEGLTPFGQGLGIQAFVAVTACI